MSLAVKIILPMAIALLTQVAAYFINQLPEVRKFPGKLWLLGRLTLWLTLLVVALEVSVSVESAEIQAFCRYGGVALLVALILDAWTLISVLRGWEVAEDTTAVASDLRERLLTEHHRTVRQRLDYAVGEQALINVVMRSQPATVNKWGDDKEVALNPVEVPQQRWRFFQFLPGRETLTITPKETILETFEHEDIGGRLLILGVPGSGKTTTLLKLADALLERAKGTQQIPYIFELSAWREDQQSIAEWLMAQLKFDYNINPVVSKQWLKDGVLLPLLDGLDELAPKRQKLCVEKINEFVQEVVGVQVVVCCRSKEYDEGNVKLSALNGALCLQPLDDGQIQKYFEDMGRRNIWEAIQNEVPLNELLMLSENTALVDEEAAEAPPLRIPLVLQILAIAYDASEHSIKSKADLFDAYIMQRLSLETRTWDRQRVSLKPTKKNWAYAQVSSEPDLLKTRQYLSWLAKHLDENNSTNNFLIEQIQPSWLDNKFGMILYWLLSNLLSLILLGSPIFLVNIVMGRPLSGLASGFVIGLFPAIIGSMTVNWNCVSSVEIIRVASVYRFRKEIIQEFLMFAPILFLSASFVGALLSSEFESRAAFSFSFFLFFSIWIFQSPINHVKEQFTIRLIPNQGIIASARNFSIYLVVSQCLFFIVGALFNLFTNRPLSSNSIANVTTQA